MMTGVSTSASNPISTLKRVTSKAFVAVRKLFPVKLQTTHSTNSTSTSAHSLFGNKRSRQSGSVLSIGAGKVDAAMMLQSGQRNVRYQRDENNCSLNCLFPEWIYANERQRRADRAK